jgi:hypothetical protein
MVQDAVNAAEAASVDDAAWCRVLRSAVGVLSSEGRADEVEPLAKRWETLARSVHDDYELAGALTIVAMASVWAGDVPAALAVLDEAVTVARRLGNPTALTYATMTSGFIGIEAEPERALSMLDEALEHASSVGNQLGTGLVLSTGAVLHLSLDDWEQAARLVVRGVDHFHRVGDQNFLKNHLYVGIELLATLGVDEQAAVLYGTTPFGRAIAEDDALPNFFVANRFREAAHSVRSRLGEDRFQACTARGARMDDDQAIAVVRDEVTRLLSQPLSRGATA